METKKQIAGGVAEFLDEYLIPSVSDKQIKIVLSMAKTAMKKDCDILDSFLSNPLISSVMPESDGMYDARNFLDIMRRAVDDGENFSVVIPKVPLLMQEDKMLRFSSADIDDLMRIMFPETEADD